nr:hypothetical protein [Tanacetum cinerariifolium]
MLAREKAQQFKEVNIAWDDIQGKIDADYQLAQRLQAEEQKRIDWTELVVESSKDAEAEVTEEPKQCLEIIPEDRDDVTIDATPLSSNRMLKNFDKEGLEVLWRLVKARFKKIKVVDYMDILLLHNLKSMFEHHVEDNVWSNQQGRIVRIKRLLDDLEVTAVKVCVTAAKQNLVLFKFVNETIVSEPIVKKLVVETIEARASADKPKVVRKNFGYLLIEDLISYSEDEAESKPKIEKKTVKPSFAKIEYVKSKEQVKSPRKTTVKQGKIVTGEVQLQALVDGKKVIITESTVRRDLQLEDAEGVNCLPNAAIFKQLTLIGETPLFPIIMVQAQEEMGKGSANPTDPHHTPTIIQLSTSQPQKKQKPRKTQRTNTELPQTSGPTTNIADEAVNKEMDNSLVRATTTASSLKAEQDSARVDSSDEASIDEDVSKQERKINDIDCDEGITLSDKTIENHGRFNDQEDAEILFDVADDLRAASIRPKAKRIVIHEQEQGPTPIVSSQQPSHVKVQDKGKGKMVKREPVKKLSKKDQLMLNEELAFKLQAKEEEEMLAREKS